MSSLLIAVYVYGTLRPGGLETVELPGLMFDMGSYPGVQLANIVAEDGTIEGESLTTFVAERILVDDYKLRRLDQYEGYREDSPQTSLYIRRPLLDGFIYEYNCGFDGRKLVEGGDWLAYRNEQRGTAARYAMQEMA